MLRTCQRLGLIGHQFGNLYSRENSSATSGHFPRHDDGLIEDQTAADMSARKTTLASDKARMPVANSEIVLRFVADVQNEHLEHLVYESARTLQLYFSSNSAFVLFESGGGTQQLPTIQGIVTQTRSEHRGRLTELRPANGELSTTRVGDRPPRVSHTEVVDWDR